MTHPAPTYGRISVRPTRPHEAEVLPGIERSASLAFSVIPELAWVAEDEVLSAAQHRRFISAGISWVAISDVRPVGFACAEDIGSDVHIWEVAVRRDMQRRGAGRALMDAFGVHAAARSASRITLTTFRDVPWNEPFYRQLGYVTLEEPALDARLRRVLDDEAASGMPATRRCAMYLAIG